MMKSDKGFFVALFVFASISAPISAQAAISITEIMYDLSGADSGYEWIEVTNEGESAEDVSAHKFFENGTNHALTLLSGSGVLAPQQSAVIIQDQSKFMAQNAPFSGVLLKASFSLSNTGEALALIDDSGDTAFSISYDASAGAAGDGNSLHRDGSIFVPGVPTPGTYSEHAGTGATVMGGESETAPQEIPQSGGNPGPEMEIEMGGDRLVGAGAGAFFEAQVYGNDVPLPNARYVWNFGDGATREGKSVFYAYAYPGVYALILSVDAGNGYSVSARRTVTAVSAEVSLRAETDGSLTVVNETRAKHDLDLSLWTLVRADKTFVIPKGTVILGGQAVRFAPELLQLSEGEPELRYPSGVVAARAEPSGTAKGVTYLDARTLPSSPAPSATVPDNGNEVKVSSSGVPDITPSEQAFASRQLAATGGSGSAFPFWLPLLGLAALIILGVAGTLYARPHAAVLSGKNETDRLAEQFEIIEDTN